MSALTLSLVLVLVFGIIPAVPSMLNTLNDLSGHAPPVRNTRPNDDTPGDTAEPRFTGEYFA